MVIKYILLIMLIGIFIIGYFIYRNVRLEQKVIGIQEKYGTVLLKKRRFRVQYINIVILTTLTFGLYMNATPIYLKTIGVNAHSDCAFNLDNDEEVIKWSDTIFIAEVNELDEIKEFNILNNDHSPLLDRYLYRFNTIFDLKGDSDLNDKLLISREVEYENLYVTDLCIEDKDIMIGEVYLFIGGYVDEESAKKQTDPRTRFGSYYYSYKSILLDDYDTSKPLEDQTDEIVSKVNFYKNIISKN